jgi:putative membrane protein
MHAIIGTVVGRWYVTLFALTFLWRASRHLGWRKTLIYAGASLVVGALAENASVHLGFPYTRYAFEESLRGQELWLFDVPLFVPLSYGFMGYFGFAAGRLVASGPWRTRAKHAWTEALLAMLLTVWALWVIDPISRLGDQFYLGPVFRYAGPGFWFGLPLASQLGFVATAAVLIALLFALTRGEPNRAIVRPLRHPHSIALVTYVVQVFHLAVIALVIGDHAIGGAAFLIWIPFAVMVAVHWSTLAPTTLQLPDLEASLERDLVVRH